MPIVRTLLVVACCLAMSFPALAQSSSQRLFRINSMLSSGFAALEEVRWSAPSNDHLAPIDRANAFAAQAEASLSVDLKNAPAYGSVAERLVELKSKVESARQVSQCHRERDAARVALAAKDVSTAKATHEKLVGLLLRLTTSKAFAAVRAQLEVESKAIGAEIVEQDWT